MHATISKMNKHVAKLRKELDEAKDKMEAAQRKVGAWPSSGFIQENQMFCCECPTFPGRNEIDI